ncbi:MAG: spore germination protein [Bacillota bacterium]
MKILDNLLKIMVFQPPQQKPFELLGPQAALGKEDARGQAGEAEGQTGGEGVQKKTGQEDTRGQPEVRNVRGDRSAERPAKQKTSAGEQKEMQNGRVKRGDPAGGEKFKRPRRATPVSAWYKCGNNPKIRCIRDSSRDSQERPRKENNLPEGDREEKFGCSNIDAGELGKVSANLKKNLQCLKKTFHVPTNKDVIFREFTIGTDPPVAAAVIYIDGMTDRVLQNLSILEPLMLLARLNVDESETLLETVIKHLLPGNQVDATAELRDVVDGILMGSTAVLVDYCPQAIIVETKGWEHRQVGRPANEMVIRGPQEGFTETLRINTALIRKSLHSPNLITEFFKIGRINRLDCAVMYIAGLTSPKLLTEVKRRIHSIKADYIGDSGMLEQFIEDNHFILVPQTLSTERPDRVIAGLTEGQVAVMVDGNPYALLVPATFFNVFQNPEDAYVRWPFGSFLRYIRLLGLFLAAFLPGIYIAVVTHHHEMIPTDLLLAISANRENVPFPSIVEVLIMEISFELIREAGIRIPGPIGPTLGIVGALILGQAAVAANIVSPILIIIVAVTAIGGFTVSNYSLSLTARFIRFFNILLGAFMGIYGLILGVFIHLHYLAAAKSFGVPYLAPVTPQAGSALDVLYRGPVWQQEKRPEYLQPQQARRQPDISRGWLNKRGGR